MQLILDTGHIDIQRNMSTIEQEARNEKFLTEKVIERLADDIAIGNKENIQKQENIILDAQEDNVIDADKEVSSSRPEIVTKNLNVEKSNENATDSAQVEISKIIADDIKNTHIHRAEQIPATLITKNINKESLSNSSEGKSEETSKPHLAELEIIEENESDIVILDKYPNMGVTETTKDISNITEIPTELNEEKENDIDKEVDISELCTELNKEAEMDLDKEEDVVEVLTDQNRENDIEMVENMVLKNKLGDDSIENKVPITTLHDKTPETDCSEIELSHNKKNENNEAIEIDDEDEKVSGQSVQSPQVIQDVHDNVDKNCEANSIKDIEKSSPVSPVVNKASEESVQPKRICRLSNNLDIFSDEEDDHSNEDTQKNDILPETEKQYINIDDDDDIMLIEDSKKQDTNGELDDTKSVTVDVQSSPEDVTSVDQRKNETTASIEDKLVIEAVEESSPSRTENKDTVALSNETSDIPSIDANKSTVDKPEDTDKTKKPLLPKSFLNTCKKNLSDMSRNDLEEFCILKIVESIVDRSNLGEIKAHLKNLTHTMEECKKKYLMLSKQNKDLQIVLKSVQEDQKNGLEIPITPLKITRSVGIQVMMVADKSNIRKKPMNGLPPQTPVPTNNTKQVKNQTPNTRNQKEKTPNNQQIPVPRLVPAPPPAAKVTPITTNIAPAAKQISNTGLPNGIRNPSPVQKVAEKRTRSQAVTVDLTDDEPPAKLQNAQRSPINTQMRVLTATPNLVAAQRFPQSINSPRKVYIPISGPPGQNLRTGQTIMLKALSGLAPRPRAQSQTVITRATPTPNSVRFGRGQPSRHPAPLPDAMKQYQPPNWKSLPPAPDLKLSKVENGIVISWKIDGYQEDNHEEIASYQLYAYQETSSPPNTALWKKIGDVKALPLPMACTLTQFMAGYKYYFAVRAIDIRSRFGPFSLPGSILLLNKM